MEVKATSKYVRVQPRKVRIVADELRGKPAAHSAALLRYHPSKGARMLRKVLMSAMANAEENHGLASDMLRIASITVDEGPRLKRIQARAMGRAYRIVKKSSHITVVVEDYEGEPRIKPHGTQAKKRPSFAGMAKAAAKKKKAEEPAVEEAAAVAEDVVEAPTMEETVETVEASEAAAEVEASAEPADAEAPAEETAAEDPAAEEAPAATEEESNEAPAESEETKGDA
jgi:large subunit ribosomal protein L22